MYKFHDNSTEFGGMFFLFVLECVAGRCLPRRAAIIFLSDKRPCGCFMQEGLFGHETLTWCLNYTLWSSLLADSNSAPAACDIVIIGGARVHRCWKIDWRTPLHLWWSCHPCWCDTCKECILLGVLHTSLLPYLFFVSEPSRVDGWPSWTLIELVKVGLW